MYQEPSALLKRLSSFPDNAAMPSTLHKPSLASQYRIYIYMYLRLIEAPDHHMAHRRRRPIPVGM